MTESTWQHSAFPIPLLRYLAADRRLTERKARLLACAMARLVWSSITENDSKQAVECAERFADRRESSIGLRLAQRFAQDHSDTFPSNLGCRIGYLIAEPTIDVLTIASLTFEILCLDTYRNHPDARSLANGHLAHLIRDLFPHADRPFDPAWRTTAVLELAGDLYETRSEASLPILADAVEEAGCNDRILLDHLRLPGGHVRGCWALDLLLGLA